MSKDRICVIFGGRSAEHEISILSASFVMDSMDTSRHEIIPVGISKDGIWHRITADVTAIKDLNDPRLEALITERGGEIVSPSVILGEADYAFPVLHGPYGEDGTIQGFFEIMDLPYAGCGVATSAIAMDKIFAKRLMERAGLPVLPYVAALRRDVMGEGERRAVIGRIEDELGYPLFVKPANMGSSVGVSMAADRGGLDTALDLALQYDERIIVEAMCHGREFEAAVLGNDEPEAARAVGEIIHRAAFYDYETKYTDGAAELSIPADIPAELADEIRSLAVKAYEAMGGSGYSRVDFFMDEASGRPVVNEMNSIPGFTMYSMFPSLWASSGLDASSLIERIIELGYERYCIKNSR